MRVAADDGPGSAIARTGVQNVIAVSGFAYGVVGADIHVFGNGLPLYLLANWPSRLAADPGWLRELPSRMLNARREASVALQTRCPAGAGSFSRSFRAAFRERPAAT